MADFQSDITTNAALAQPAQLRPYQQGGRIRAMRAKITWAAAPQIADKLLCFTMRKGWCPMPGGLVIPSVALGAAATLALGVTGTVNKYLTATIMNTAGGSTFFNQVANLEPLAADEDWFLTVAAAALPAAGTVL